MSEQVLHVDRVMTADEATMLVGSPVGTDLEPTFPSPPAGGVTRLMCEGETVAIVTRLPPRLRSGIRHLVTHHKYGQNVGRLPKKGKQVLSMMGAGCPVSVVDTDHLAAAEVASLLVA